MIATLPITFGRRGESKYQGMPFETSNPVVHLELQTANAPRACAFYTRLLGWRAERVHVGSASYVALEVGERIGGGVVEGDPPRPFWLPYVEVADVYETTAHACLLGAAVSITPRDGPGGRRSVIAAPAGGEVGLWQPNP